MVLVDWQQVLSCLSTVATIRSISLVSRSVLLLLNGGGYNQLA